MTSTIRRRHQSALAGLAVSLALSALAQPALAQRATLEIYYIDTEGGQATLFIGPTGESLLVDTGNAGERDLGRILDTLDMAGIDRIDHLWTTHYHGDHVGALPALAERVPIGHFYDHGEPHADDRIVSGDFLAAYDALTRGKRTVVEPGYVLPMEGVEIVAVASNGGFIGTALPGGGSRNAACAAVSPVDESNYFDPDNGASAGFVLTFGRFRTVDLGDLTWNGELALMCPQNPIGTVDVYLTSHHGLAQSGSPALVHALEPRVAVMNNGTRKGGAPETFGVLHASPGLEDLWQLHWSHNARLENSPAAFIANVDDDATVAEVLTAEPAARGGPGGGPGRGGFGPGGTQGHAPAYLIHVAAHSDGSFVVTNTRNRFSKSYAPAR
jgi:beta-lactamase superfamily II metal-dependent hydrolase